MAEDVFFISPLTVPFLVSRRCDLGESGLLVRGGGGPGGGLRTARPPGHGPHHRGLHGGVCPQESDLVAEEERRLGKRC